MKNLLLLLLCLPVFALAQVDVQNLLAENLNNPIGLDSKQPRFSWQLNSSKRNSSQTAYEIKVSSGKTAVWNSGKIVSDQSVQVPYSGDALQSGKKYTWQVRVWDNNGKTSSWSKAASFQMGLLNTSDWKAQWIEAGFQEDTLSRPPQYFRNQFSVAKKIASATLYITAHGMYEAQINGKRVGDQYLSPGWTSYNKRLQYQVYDVTNLLSNGKNVAGVIVANGWYRGFLAWSNNKNIYGNKLALLFQMEITYTDGTSSLVV
ncbi:MAG: alpha-L-rhamnosidase N-terminal domain-containing protein, partial [Chitinophagaceae bacterium]